MKYSFDDIKYIHNLVMDSISVEPEGMWSIVTITGTFTGTMTIIINEVQVVRI